MLACRLLDLTEVNGDKVDLMIGLKFPAYLIPHPRKVLWLLHQHRAAYDLWDSPLGDLARDPVGAQVREAVARADRNLIPEAERVFTISHNVTGRLGNYCRIPAATLYHPPPGAEDFYCADAQDYLFFPSRLWHSKRQSLVIEALARTKHAVRVRFAGTADSPGYEEELRDDTKRLGVHDRIRWEGAISEAAKRRLYAEALGIVYPPVDEDYGYVTLEAMLASKPVVTCADSGGTLEFVAHHKTGIVAEPTPAALAAALDYLWAHRDQAHAWGLAARERYEALGISWSNVVNRLTFAD
jgi:glycosyltransferase involved in cell wall biosynthesis